jgi:hypothetical protein
MARLKTTKVETHYFEQFLRHFSLPVGDVSYGGEDDDRPDLVVKERNSDKILLGIEQTRFYVESGKSPSSEQVQAKRRTDVLEKAEAEYKKRGSGNLRLSISFNKEFPICSTDEIVAKLVSLLTEIDASESGHLSSKRIASIPEIDFLYVQWNVDAPWQLTQVHSVQLTSKQKLQALIDEKDRQAAGYRRCSDLWLLVVIDFFDTAQDQEIDDKIDVLVSNKFSKAILFKTVFNQVKEIPCIKREVPK